MTGNCEMAKDRIHQWRYLRTVQRKVKHPIDRSFILPDVAVDVYYCVYCLQHTEIR